MFERWARFVTRHKWRVFVTTVLAIALLTVVSAQAGGSFSDRFRIPGAESQTALDLLEERFPSESGDVAMLVVRSSAVSVSDPALRDVIEPLLARIATVPQVVSLSSPYEDGSLVSADGRTAFSVIQFTETADAVDEENVAAILAATQAVAGPDLQIELGGPVIRGFEEQGPGESEGIGLAAAAVVLLIAFGSVIAMGLPIVTALLGLAAGFAMIGLIALLLDISTFAPSFAAMLGIGVGIDYSLFIVTRFREGLAAGASVEQAVITAVSTAGRAVVFAAAVVVISLLGLFAIGIPFVANLGLAAAVTVALSAVVSLSALPALLTIVGHRIDRWSVPFLRSGPPTGRPGRWYRFSRTIQRRPLLFLVAATAFLLLLAAPLLDIELGVTDDGNSPASFTSRRAYDLLADGFGPGFNGPLLLVVSDDDGIDTGFLENLRENMLATQNVAKVSSPSFNDAGDAAVLTVVPATAPQDRATRDLVDHLRDAVIPFLVVQDDQGPAVFVAGATASFIDMSERIESRLVLFFALVIGLSFVLLVVAFRSIVVPLKAALLNLLSIGAAVGFIVIVFQWGWGKELVGIDRTGPIESFLPMFLFAILFGLSMDYEVFLLSRIRERFLETGDSSESVAHGISTSARVITAAAAILITVFLSFALGDERVIKEFGVGLSVAILIDATIVRLVLVPAAMELMGDANWWMPRWLDRLLPRLNIDPHIDPAGGVERALDAPKGTP